MDTQVIVAVIFAGLTVALFTEVNVFKKFVTWHNGILSLGLVADMAIGPVVAGLCLLVYGFERSGLARFCAQKCVVHARRHGWHLPRFVHH